LNFAVLRAAIEEPKEQWMVFWSRLPSGRRDGYFLPEYLLASEKSGLGNAACAVAWSDSAIWLYPFLICEIDGSVKACADAPCVDIMTPYGYGGPVVTEQGEDPAFLASAWGQFRDWAVTHMIVGEFIRFHPLLRNSR